jgi:hypothetical protein
MSIGLEVTVRQHGLVAGVCTAAAAAAQQ